MLNELEHLLALGDQRGHLAFGTEKLSTLGRFFYLTKC